jgi:anti-sigma B factor antagonist
MHLARTEYSAIISATGTDNQTDSYPSLCNGEARVQKGATMLNLTIHNLDDVTVFHCAGRITAEDKGKLQRAVLSQPHIRMVVLDLAEVTAVDAAGVGMLVLLRLWANATGTKLKLMNLTPRVEEVLQLTKLRSAFEVCSVREMMDLLCRANRQFQAHTATASAVAV